MTELQNHRFAGVGIDLKRSSLIPLLKHVPYNRLHRQASRQVLNTSIERNNNDYNNFYTHTHTQNDAQNNCLTPTDWLLASPQVVLQLFHMMSYGIKYPVGKLRSAVPVLSPPSSFCCTRALAGRPV